MAVINEEFARKIFGSVTRAIGRHHKISDGTRIQVVGVVEDGKYLNLTEAQHSAMFFPILQSPSSGTNLVVRSNRDPQQLAGAMRSALRNLDPGLPSDIERWNKELELALFPSRIATVSLGVLGMMGAMLSITGIFGLTAYSVSRRLRELGIRMALGAQRTEVLQAALGRAFKWLVLVQQPDCFGEFLRAGCWLSSCIRQLPAILWVLAGVILVMALLGYVDSSATRALA